MLKQEFVKIAQLTLERFCIDEPSEFETDLPPEEWRARFAAWRDGIVQASVDPARTEEVRAFAAAILARLEFVTPSQPVL